MAEVGTAYVSVEADMSNFDSQVSQAGDDMAKSFGDVGKQAGGEFEGGLSPFLSQAGSTMAGVLGADVVTKATGAIADFGKASVNAAMEDAKAQVILANTLKNVTGASDDQVAATEDWITKTSKQVAIADDDLRPALGTLVRGFGNVEDAQKALSLATDISAGTGKDLTTVSMALSRAAQGNVGALSRLGVATKDANGNTKDLTTIMADLNQMFGGQAAAAADTAAGRMENAKIQFGEFQEQLGTALLPVLTTLVGALNDYVIPALSAVASWVEDHKDVIVAAFIGFGTVVGAVVIPAFVAWAAAAATAAAATLAAAAPFIAIGAVIAGVAYLIIHNWDTIKAATQAVWDFVLGTVKAVWDWITQNWPLLLAILTGPFGALVYLVVNNWDTIVDTVKAVWQWIVDNWPLLLAILTGPFGLAIKFVVDHFDEVKRVVQSVIDGAKSIVSGFIDTLRNLPGQVKGIFADAARWLYDAGANIIKGLIDGIKSQIGKVTDAIGSVTSVITDHLPWSPAKLGPLHDHPPEEGGANIVTQIQRGLDSAAVSLAGPLGGISAGVGVGGGGAVNAPLNIYGNVYGVDDLDTWADQRDAKLVAALAVGTR